MTMYTPTANMAAINDLYSSHPSLQKFVVEFCAEFPNVRVDAKPNSKQMIELFDDNGIPVGAIFVEEGARCAKDNKKVPVYFYESACVRKERWSGKGRNTRDSVSIKSLIKTIKTQKESPSASAFIQAQHRGIMYAFDALRAKRHRIELDLSHDLQFSLISFFLELDKASVFRHTEEIKTEFENYLSAKKYQENHDKNYYRFAEGCHLIGLSEDGYYVGEVSLDTKSNDGVVRLEDHVPLKRYSTLKDHPLAGTIAMIKAWASGKDFHDPKNERGIPAKDIYHEEIDIATGYQHSNLVWCLIPKAPA